MSSTKLLASDPVGASRGTPGKVLLVDDDPVLLLLMISAFNAAGYITVAAENGRKAIALLDAFEPDLVITDIVMPEMEGIGIILEIHRATVPPKVIAISGGMTSSTRNYLKWARQLGADAALPKPFRMSALLTLARQTLDDRSNINRMAGG